MLNCPFHEDKTASLQVNLEKHFYKCHACGAKGDQIQWVQDYEKITKHEAIVKCEQMAGNQELVVWEMKPKTIEISKLQAVNFLEKMFSSFKKGLVNSQPAKDYCKKRNLDHSKLNIGFNSGQFHHGERKSEELINRNDMRSSNITYFKASFASYRILAQHVLHELFHAHYNYMGYWNHLETKYNSITARNISEYYSYRLCNQYAGTPYYYSVDYSRGAAFIQGMPYSDVPFMIRK